VFLSLPAVRLAGTSPGSSRSIVSHAEKLLLLLLLLLFLLLLLLLWKSALHGINIAVESQ
jgi:hypothetical protein